MSVLGETPDEKQIAIKIPKEYLERFNNLKRENNLTQSELFCALLNSYEAKDPRKAVVPLILTCYKQVLGSRLSTYKYSFSGTIIYQSCWSLPNRLDHVTAQKLQQDFGVPVSHFGAYDYSHCLTMYYHAEKQCYLVSEGISVLLQPTYKGEPNHNCNPDDWAGSYYMPPSIHPNPLEVLRFHFVTDFDDFYQKFGRYATNDDLGAVSEVLATDIGDDFSLLDELFSLGNPQ